MARITDEDKMQALADWKGVDVSEVENNGEFQVDGESYDVYTDEEADDVAHQRCVDLMKYDLGLEALSENAQEWAIENACDYDWESDLEESNRNYARDVFGESDSEYGNRAIQELEDRNGLGNEDGGFVIKFEDDKGNELYLSDKKDNEYTDDIRKAKRFLSESDALAFDTDDLEDTITNDFGEEFIDSWDGFDAEFHEELVDEDDICERLADCMNYDYNSMGEYYESIYGRNWAREMRDVLKDYIDWDTVADYVIESDGRANQISSWDGREVELGKVNGEYLYAYRQG